MATSEFEAPAGNVHPADGCTANLTAAGDAPANDRAAGQAATGQAATGQAAAGQAAAGQAAAGQAAAGQTGRRRSWRFRAGLAAAVLLFAALAVYARLTPFFALDLPLARAIQALDNRPLVALLEGVSWIGFPPQIVILSLLMVAGLFVAGHRRQAAFLLVVGLGAALLWFSIGNAVDRPRPDANLVRVAYAASGSSSFPSGHVLSTTAIFGFLVYLVYVQYPPSWRRTLALLVVSLPILTVGVARVYDGHHWPSDVLGGYLLGGLWLAVVTDAYRRRPADELRAGQQTSSKQASRRVQSR